MLPNRCYSALVFQNMLKLLLLMVALFNTINAGRYPYGSKYAPSVYYSLRNPDKSFNPMPSIIQVTIATSPPNKKCVSPKNVCKRDYQCPSHQKCFEDLFCGYKVCKNTEITSSAPTTTTEITTKSPLTTEPPCTDTCVQCVVSRYRCEFDSQCPPCYTCCQDIYYVYKVCKHVSNVTTTSALTTISTTLSTSDATTAVTTTLTTSETTEASTVSETTPTTTTTKATTKFTVPPEPDIDGNGSGSGSGDGDDEDDESGWDVRPFTGSTRNPEIEFSFNEVEEIVTNATTSSKVETSDTFEPTTTFKATTLKPTTAEIHMPDEEFSGDEERSGDDEDTDTTTSSELEINVNNTFETTTTLKPTTAETHMPDEEFSGDEERSGDDEDTYTTTSSEFEINANNTFETTTTLKPTTAETHMPDEEFSDDEERSGDDEDTDAINIPDAIISQTASTVTQLPETITEQILENLTPRVTDTNRQRKTTDENDIDQNGNGNRPIETKGDERYQERPKESENDEHYFDSSTPPIFQTPIIRTQLPETTTEKTFETTIDKISKNLRPETLQPSVHDDEHDYEIENTRPSETGSRDEETVSEESAVTRTTSTPNEETANGNERNIPDIKEDETRESLTTSRTVTDQEESAEYSGNDDEDGFSSGDDTEEFSGNGDDKVLTTPNEETANGNERNRPNIKEDETRESLTTSRTVTDQEESAEYSGNDDEDGFSSGDDTEEFSGNGDDKVLTTPNEETANGNERNRPNIKEDETRESPTTSRTVTDQEGSAKYSGNDDEDGFSIGDDAEESSGNVDDKVPHPPRKDNSARHEEMDKNAREELPLINDLEVLPDVKPDSYLSNKDYYVIVDDYE